MINGSNKWPTRHEWYFVRTERARTVSLLTVLIAESVANYTARRFAGREPSARADLAVRGRAGTAARARRRGQKSGVRGEMGGGRDGARGRGWRGGGGGYYVCDCRVRRATGIAGTRIVRARSPRTTEGRL